MLGNTFYFSPRCMTTHKENLVIESYMQELNSCEFVSEDVIVLLLEDPFTECQVAKHVLCFIAEMNHGVETFFL